MVAKRRGAVRKRRTAGEGGGARARGPPGSGWLRPMVREGRAAVPGRPAAAYCFSDGPDPAARSGRPRDARPPGPLAGDQHGGRERGRARGRPAVRHGHARGALLPRAARPPRGARLARARPLHPLQGALLDRVVRGHGHARLLSGRGAEDLRQGRLAAAGPPRHDAAARARRVHRLARPGAGSGCGHRARRADARAGLPHLRQPATAVLRRAWSGS
jgi:hypothetical protein